MELFLIHILRFFYKYHECLNKRETLWVLKQIRRQFKYEISHNKSQEANRGICGLVLRYTSMIGPYAFFDKSLLVPPDNALSLTWYWWPIEDRASRLEYINELINKIKYGK